MSKRVEMTLSQAMQKGLGSVLKPYYQHKKRIERENRPKKDYTIYRSPRKILKDYLFEIFPEAYKIASDNGSFTPMVRQLYYVVRRLLQETDFNKELTDSSHRSNLEEYEQLEVGYRICSRKAVASLLEPHSACPVCGRESGCALGTVGADNYEVPDYQYNKVLYVEKTGFMQQLLAANIHKKYDIAIAAGAGFAVHAAKELFAKIEKSIPVKIYCLHDADISGVEIARTLGKKLLFEDYRVEVIDLGLRPQEAINIGLPQEEVKITSKPSERIKEMVTEEEYDWLLGEDIRYQRRFKKSGRRILYIGNRCELNAFTPKEFIAWVDNKLASLEGKVIPEEKTIEKETEEILDDLVKEKVIEEFIEKVDYSKRFLKTREGVKTEGITKEFIEKNLKGSFSSWKEIIKEELKERLL